MLLLGELIVRDYNRLLQNQRLILELKTETFMIIRVANFEKIHPWRIHRCGYSNRGGGLWVRAGGGRKVVMLRGNLDTASGEIVALSPILARRMRAFR